MKHDTQRSSLSPVCLVVAVSLLGVQIAWADVPDLELNPVSGNVESVDIATGSNDRVQHVEDEGQGERGSSTLVSTASAANPRIAKGG